jgi:hypothetical protein
LPLLLLLVAGQLLVLRLLPLVRRLQCRHQQQPLLQGRPGPLLLLRQRHHVLPLPLLVARLPLQLLWQLLAPLGRARVPRALQLQELACVRRGALLQEPWPAPLPAAQVAAPPGR